MSSQNAFQKNLNKESFNLLFFSLLFLAFALSLFLSWKEVQAGFIYALMFIGGAVFLFVVFLFLKDDKTLKPVSDYARIPIATRTKLPLASFMYLVGLSIPPIIQGIVGLFSSFNITSLSIPLFSSGIEEAFQSFSATEIGNQMSWRIFIQMFCAGTIETFVYNIVFVLVGVVIALLIFRLFSADGKTLLFIPKRGVIIILGIFVIPILGFILSHLLNQTYSFWMYVIAGIFLGIANYSIYFAGVFALFWVGYHQSNNLVALIIKDGLFPVLEGFISWFGLIFIIFIVGIILFVLRNWDTVKKQFSNWTNT